MEGGEGVVDILTVGGGWFGVVGERRYTGGEAVGFGFGFCCRRGGGLFYGRGFL